MPTSGLVDYTTNRNGIILRALRIIGAIGQGETAEQNQTAVDEAAEALNDLVKEWQADGMPLWAMRIVVIDPLLGVASYALPDGPLKVIQAWRHNVSVTPAYDTPINIITNEEYLRLSPKFSSGPPNQIYYETPGSDNAPGYAIFWPVPDAATVANEQLLLHGQFPFEYFVDATDVPDFPSYWYNAIKWGLADQLAYEYGVGITERAQISKKAEKHKTEALSFGTEEGSYYLQPTPRWGEWDR